MAIYDGVTSNNLIVGTKDGILDSLLKDDIGKRVVDRCIEIWDGTKDVFSFGSLSGDISGTKDGFKVGIVEEHVGSDSGMLVDLMVWALDGILRMFSFFCFGDERCLNSLREVVEGLVVGEGLRNHSFGGK